jgi:hypothetical protein
MLLQDVFLLNVTLSLLRHKQRLLLIRSMSAEKWIYLADLKVNVQRAEQTKMNSRSGHFHLNCPIVFLSKLFSFVRYLTADFPSPLKGSPNFDDKKTSQQSVFFSFQGATSLLGEFSVVH